MVVPSPYIPGALAFPSSLLHVSHFLFSQPNQAKKCVGYQISSSSSREKIPRIIVSFLPFTPIAWIAWYTDCRHHPSPTRPASRSFQARQSERQPSRAGGRHPSRLVLVHPCFSGFRYVSSLLVPMASTSAPSQPGSHGYCVLSAG